MWILNLKIKSKYINLCSTAAADKVALVIGNQNYAHSKLKGLQYPEQDATDVATALTQLNFKVFCGIKFFFDFLAGYFLPPNKFPLVTS